MTPLLRKIDCVRFYVDNLDAALTFYRDKLGHALVWRTDTAAGLSLPDSDAEIVLQTERRELEIDFTVEAVEQAVADFEAAGGKIVVPPFEIQIGKAAVVADPWGNAFVLLDTRKGLLTTDADGHITGNQT
jgi:predicted enzyme related to lactoylglutathione lyase